MILSYFLHALILTYSSKYTTDPNNPDDHSNGVRKDIARTWVPSKCEDYINNIDDNIIENISLILDDESINTKARVTIGTDNVKRSIFRHNAVWTFGHVRVYNECHINKRTPRHKHLRTKYLEA